MKKLYLIIAFTFLTTFCFGQGVGINETNPQQNLHLGSSTGTIRVDGLNTTNNAFNGGGSRTYPLYVNANGDFTLQLDVNTNSNGSDAITSTTPGASTALVIPAPAVAPNNGYRSTVILPYTFTVNRAAIVEVKYNISFQVLASAGVNLASTKARTIQTFYTIDTPTLVSNLSDINLNTKRYGQASKTYMNYNLSTPMNTQFNGASGNLFNSSTTYITVGPGTHTLRFYGACDSGALNEATLVNFAIANDSVFIRIH